MGIRWFIKIDTVHIREKVIKKLMRVFIEKV